MKTNWKFYGEKMNGFWSETTAFIASNENGGHVMDKNGGIGNIRINPHYSLANRKQYVEQNYEKEITLKQALALIKRKDRVNPILKFLKISLEPVIITDDIKNKIINNLKQSRAFNGDSALKVDDDKELDIYDALSESQVINSVGFENRFYISEKSI